MKVSVIIPNYNGQKLLAQNLPQVIKSCPDCEIIVVDDASTDNSVSYLKKYFPQLIIIENKTNQRFAKSCNIGAQNASGEILIFLNSDVSPQENFLKPLINHFVKSNQIFSVGSKEIDNTNNQEIISGRTVGKISKGLLVHWKPENQEDQDTLWNFGGSMAVSRHKFLTLGGFDPIYAPAYWEDIDLSWRARRKAWKVLFEKDSIVYHNHETTNKSVFGSKKIQEISLRNQIIFSLKHFKFQFLLWLPYHLLITNYKTKGLFFQALLLALKRCFSK